MTKQSLDEAKVLQDKITSLEAELAQGGEITNALAAGEQVSKKREIEGVQDQFDKELKKLSRRQETLEKQIAEQIQKQNLNQREMNALRE